MNEDQEQKLIWWKDIPNLKDYPDVKVLPDEVCCAECGRILVPYELFRPNLKSKLRIRYRCHNHRCPAYLRQAFFAIYNPPPGIDEENAQDAARNLTEENH